VVTVLPALQLLVIFAASGALPPFLGTAGLAQESLVFHHRANQVMCNRHALGMACLANTSRRVCEK